MRETGKSKTSVWRWQSVSPPKASTGTSARQDAAFAHRQGRSLHRRARHRADHGGASTRSDAFDRRGDGPRPAGGQRFRGAAHLARSWASAASRRAVHAVQKTPPSSTSCATSSGSSSTRRRTPSSFRLKKEPEWRSIERSPAYRSRKAALEPWRTTTSGTGRRGVFRSVADLQTASSRITTPTRSPSNGSPIPDKIIAAVRRGHQVLDSVH